MVALVIFQRKKDIGLFRQFFFYDFRNEGIITKHFFKYLENLKGVLLRRGINMTLTIIR